METRGGKGKGKEQGAQFRGRKESEWGRERREILGNEVGHIRLSYWVHVQILSLIHI